MAKKIRTKKSLPTPKPNARALITGASQGIGMAMAKDLAKMGHNLLLVARREEILRELADELVQKYGIICEVRPCDLADETQRHALIDEITNREISIIINSAGIASFGPWMEQDWDYELKQYHLNGTAVFELTRAVLPGMIERGEGAVLNIGSQAGDLVIPNNATYVLTKAGVNSFTESLHYELKGTGVHCTLLSPGPVRENEIPESEMTVIDRVVPDFVWTTYESCSQETLEAMAENRRRVVPGPLGKVMGFLGWAVPVQVAAPLLGRMYKKMGA